MKAVKNTFDVLKVKILRGDFRGFVLSAQWKSTELSYPQRPAQSPCQNIPLSGKPPVFLIGPWRRRRLIFPGPFFQPFVKAWDIPPVFFPPLSGFQLPLKAGVNFFYLFPVRGKGGEGFFREFPFFLFGVVLPKNLKIFRALPSKGGKGGSYIFFIISYIFLYVFVGCSLVVRLLFVCCARILKMSVFY